MSRIGFRCCCFAILCINVAHSQDLKGITDDKREVLLRKSGVWFFIERTELEDCRATLNDGRRVILNRNGSWSFSKQPDPAPSNADVSGGRMPESSEVLTNPERYHHERYHFSIIYPAGWETTNKSLGHVLCKPPQGQSQTFTHMVEVKTTNSHSPLNLDEYSVLYMASAKQAIENYQEIDHGNIPLAGTNARWILFSGKLKNVSMKIKAYMMVRGEYGYEIAYYSRIDQYAAYTNIFENFVQSFEFE